MTLPALLPNAMTEPTIYFKETVDQKTQSAVVISSTFHVYLFVIIFRVAHKMMTPKLTVNFSKKKVPKMLVFLFIK